MYPATELEYTHDVETSEFTLKNVGGEVITAENTGWIALYVGLRPLTVNDQDDPKTFVEAWNVAGGDTAFPMKESEGVVVEGVDVDHQVYLEWSEPDGKMRNWERWRVWREYSNVGYFSMELDEEANEIVMGRPSDEKTLTGTGGYSIQLVVDRHFEDGYVLAGPDSGGWGFPIESGSEFRVPVEELSDQSGTVEPFWVGPNNWHTKQGTTTGYVRLG